MPPNYRERRLRRHVTSSSVSNSVRRFRATFRFMATFHGYFEYDDTENDDTENENRHQEPSVNENATHKWWMHTGRKTIIPVIPGPKLTLLATAASADETHPDLQVQGPSSVTVRYVATPESDADISNITWTSSASLQTRELADPGKVEVTVADGQSRGNNSWIEGTAIPKKTWFNPH